MHFSTIIVYFFEVFRNNETTSPTEPNQQISKIRINISRKIIKPNENKTRREEDIPSSPNIQIGGKKKIFKNF